MNRVLYDRYGNKKVITDTTPKIFYDEDGNKTLIYPDRGIIGYGEYGIVYKLTEDTCIKHITNDSTTDPEVLKTIMNMELKSIYKIFKLLYDRYKNFNGYKMKYYDGEDIDITTMPVSYTLDNFRDMHDDFNKLTHIGTEEEKDKHNIEIRDIHLENIIMNKDKITIIDIDNSCFSQSEYLEERNMRTLYNLFIEIYLEHLEKYHKITFEEARVVRRLFNATKDIYNELNGYKYPIDYIRKKSLEPFKYVMKKGM